MAVRHFTITLAAAVQNLATAEGIARGGPDDLGYRTLYFQATGADAFLGESTVTTTDYGLLIESTGQPTEEILGASEAGPLHLSDFYAVGAGSTLHILGIPF